MESGRLQRSSDKFLQLVSLAIALWSLNGRKVEGEVFHLSQGSLRNELSLSLSPDDTNSPSSPQQLPLQQPHIRSRTSPSILFLLKPNDKDNKAVNLNESGTETSGGVNGSSSYYMRCAICLQMISFAKSTL